MATVHIEQGDLTACAFDAIVNAANNELVLGGGLAGAIRRRGGQAIEDECDRHGPIEVGQAAITTGGDLPAKYVIHQASMALGTRTTASSLRVSTRAVLHLAEAKEGVTTLAFPAVGTGIAGFDMARCAEIMLDEVAKHLAGPSKLTDVYFVLADPHALEVFRRTWEMMSGKKTG
jgi:O-acetyl-ADP-ribose deacetylase